jgi:hypothetical protein
MNKSSLFLFSTTLAIVFSNLLIAGEIYTEPPILHKEIELQKQSEAKKAREQASRAEEEKGIAKENAKAQAERVAEEKKVAAERERLAKEAEAKRVPAERERLAKEAEAKRVAQEKAASEAEEKRFDEIKSAVAEKAKQERLAREKTQKIYHPACIGGDNSLCSVVVVALNLKGKLCYRVINIVPMGNDSFEITCELASFDRSLITYTGRLY